jgi:diguanylate cyclase (GGDEF)-like protein
MVNRDQDGPRTEDIRTASIRDSELGEALYKLLYLDEFDTRTLSAELRRMEETAGEAVYSELIFMLSHLRFEPDEARRHWTKIVAHADSLERRLAATMDLRVALVSYFIHVNRQFKTPKIIELQLYEQTRSFAYRDELTGLLNYRALCEHLNREVHRSDRGNSPLSLIMLDVDHFKNYNDQNGHDAGNDTLALLAQLVRRTVRRVDLTARYGGEEFAVILPDTTKVETSELAERLRVAVESYPFPHSGAQPGGRLTVSLGVATYPGDAEGSAGLIRGADRALYVAKDRGRNQVELYGDDRRSYRRRDATLSGFVRTLTRARRSISTLNLSERGVLYLDDKRPEDGSLIELTLELPGGGRSVSVIARVATVREAVSGRFEVGAGFVDTSSEARHALMGYLRDSGSTLHEELVADPVPI